MMKPNDEELKKCVNDHSDEGIIGTLIVRKISIKITKYIARTELTPNQISFISFFIGILGACLISLGIWKYLVCGGIMIIISYIFDNVDGEIARLKNLGSKKGAFIDNILDRIKEGFIFLGISAAIYTQTNNYLAWVFGFIAFFSVVMTNLVIDSSGKLDKSILRSVHGELLIIKKIKSWGIKPSFLTLGVDVQLFIIALGAILNRLVLVIWFFMILQNLYWIIILILVFKRK